MSITSASSKRARARITRQGQITVPKSVRDRLGARPGDQLEFEQYGDAFIIRHRPRVSILDFAGLAASSAEQIPQTAEELDALIERSMLQHAVDEDARIVARATRQRRTLP